MTMEMNKNGHSKEDSGNQTRKTNSLERANIFKRLLFMWLIPLFWKGNSKDLTTNDVCQPLSCDKSKEVSDILEDNWRAEVGKCLHAKRKPSFIRVLFKTFVWQYTLDGVLLFIMSVFSKSCQPILLAMLIDYFSVSSTTTKDMAYVYAAGVVGLSLVTLFLQHHTNLRTAQLGMRVRVACCSLLYRKVLRLSSKSLGETTAGQVVNLMSNDVGRFDQVFMFLHYIWILPFQVILTCYLIYTRVNISALIGVFIMCLQTLPVQTYMSRLSAKLRKKIAVRTDERVRIMNEIISGIQVIKMYAWEKPFEKVVSASRVRELNVIRKSSYLRGIYMSFMVFTERFTLYVTLLAFSLLGNKVESATVFSLAQFYNILQQILAIMYPTAISSAAECMVTVKRLQNFLLLEERPDLSLVNEEAESEEGKKALIRMKYAIKPEDKLNGSKYNMSENSLDKGLTNLGFDSNDFPTDYDLQDQVSVDIQNVTASWTSDAQSPTLTEIDFQVPKGSLCAIIGAVGSGKSSILQLLLKELPVMTGSYKLNGTISYASQEPWLFVSSVRNNILYGLPYDHKRYREVVRVCALVKDFQQFPKGDQTLVGERGVSLSGGQRARINLARAVYREADIYLLDDPLSAVDAHVGRHLYSECISKFLYGKTTLLVTHQLHYLKSADKIIILNNGRVENMGTYEELASSGQEFSNILAASQETQKDDDEEYNKPTVLRRKISQMSVVSAKSEFDNDEEKQEGEEQLTGRIKAHTYLAYLKNGGSASFVIFMIVLMIFGQLGASFSDYWVTYWTNQQSMEDLKTYTSNVDLNNSTSYVDIHEKVGRFTIAEYLYIYTGIIISCIFLTLSRSTVFYQVCMNSSKNLHDKMFRNILKGVMRFFDTNPSGRILNRFSKDIGAVDELLPRAALDALQIFLVMCSILILVSITNPFMLIPVAVLSLIFGFIFRLYIRTAQDIKRLEGITRSPVFSHVSTTINGLATIRSCLANKRMVNDFDTHQDLHTSAWFQYLACSCHLGFWLDMFCVVFLAIVTVSFVIFNDGTVLSGNVGLAISQSLILTGMLQYGVRQLAEMVSQMTSVERILQYNTIEQEKNLETGNRPTPEGWPSKGEITFDHTYLKYSDFSDPVIKDLNIHVKNGWKVGIVGRTGAGKSSLIAALFRLAKLDGGIRIDSLETGDLSKQDLRSRISIIPQEPVLFSATVRYNLDPFGLYSDLELWHALEDVDLKDSIPSLDFKVSEGGANFSLGQRQLICLARAILRKNQILVLDEATANVDPQTDHFIQKTIREKFKTFTVLTIAHRLNTIMDSDRVLVMDSGRMVEFDHPHILLSNSDGHFFKMVAETGEDMAMKLHKIAKDAYEDEQSDSLTNSDTSQITEKLDDDKQSDGEDKS